MVIVISSPTAIRNEQQIIQQLFEQGLDHFQIYKPHFSEKQTVNFMQQIPVEYHPKVTLHNRIFKFHSLKELEDCKEKYDYAFLSPVFDSISKNGYKSKFDLKELTLFLKDRMKKLIALGGVDEDKVDIIREVGFYGIAIHGALWQNENPIEKFNLIQEKWLKSEFVY